MTGAHYVAFTESLQNCVVVTILGVLKVFVHDISLDKCTLEHC